MKVTRSFLAMTLSVGLAACGNNTPPGPQCSAPVAGVPQLRLRMVAQVTRPVGLYAVRGDTTRLYILEQHTGRIRIVKDGMLLPTPFLTIGNLATGNEQGLLGLAFHPQYAQNGRFFVSYTDAGNSQIEEFKRSTANEDLADATRVRTILTVAQPATNHKGGGIGFGPDGFLYIGLGDGGNQYDPQGNGQRLDTLLGKMLRIDVNGAPPYTSPPGNPFVGMGGGARAEIWSRGFRNPWRWSFDRANGNLWMGDVGQDRWEEISFEPAATGGRNYGWGMVEGNNHCPMNPTTTCTPPAGAIAPVLDIDQSGGACAVVGGYVYRGCVMPDLRGTYFFSDNCLAAVKSFPGNGQPMTAADVTTHPQLAQAGISSFGEDSDGELYICSVTQGRCWQIIPQ